MTPEQAASAIHAAKMAQKMAMERNLDKLPHSFFPSQLDISKISNSDSKNLNLPNVTIEPTSNNSGNKSGNSGMDKRRSDHSDRDEHHHHHHHHNQQQQQNLMSINNNSSNNNNNTINSYSKEESSADERNLSDDESIAVN